MTLADILAAIAVVINELPVGLLALAYGFAAFPTGLAFGIGAMGALAFRSIAPISFQAETIALAGSLGENRRERLCMVFWTGIIMTVVGILGLLTPAIEFIGSTIMNAMMAGVGIILARVGVEMTRHNLKVGSVSILTALLTYVISRDLVLTILLSVFLSTLISLLSRKSVAGDLNPAHEKLEWVRPFWNGRIVRGTLALLTIQVGGNIAYGNITGNIAGRSVNVDHLTVFSGVASAVSAAFGGGPVETIISGTGAAPNPLTSGILMMSLMAVVLFLRLLPVIAKYVPAQSIAGFLIILGALVVFPYNMSTALAEQPLLAGATAVVTASTDPFIGIIAGVVLRLLLGLFGAG